MNIKNKHIAKLLLTLFKEARQCDFNGAYVYYADIEKIINDVFGDDVNEISDN